MRPKYGENLIVGIINEGDFMWCVLNIDDCHLDFYKWAKIFNTEYIPTDERNGISIVNNETKIDFLNYIYASNMNTTTSELRNMLIGIECFEDKLEFQPSILINFDKEEFINDYVEPNVMNKVVPDNWKSSFGKFTKYIRQEEMFWKNGDENLIREGYNEQR